MNKWDVCVGSRIVVLKEPGSAVVQLLFAPTILSIAFLQYTLLSANKPNLYKVCARVQYGVRIDRAHRGHSREWEPVFPMSGGFNVWVLINGVACRGIARASVLFALLYLYSLALSLCTSVIAHEHGIGLQVTRGNARRRVVARGWWEISSALFESNFWIIIIYLLFSLYFVSTCAYLYTYIQSFNLALFPFLVVVCCCVCVKIDLKLQQCAR